MSFPTFHASHAPSIRVPEDLVLLELETDRQAGIEDHPAVWRMTWPKEALNRQEHPPTGARERWRRPSRIGSIADHDLYLVRRLEPAEAVDAGVTSPEPGVLMSRITRTRGSTRGMSIAPLVSSKTVLRGVGKLFMSG